MSGIEQIEQLVAEINRAGSIPREIWPADAQLAPADLGLVERKGALLWSMAPDPIDLSNIERAFPDLHCRRFDLIDSTNTLLVAEGSRGSIASRLYVAEFQYGGRGRRGRTWLSPYGRNLAMSLGFGTQREMAELGGLSVVVGLALADAVDELGVSEVQLKWPNDLLVAGAKLSGILIELVQRPEALEVVVGIGVNVSLTAGELEAIGQPAADLRRAGVSMSRTNLVIDLMTRVRTYLDLFEAEGFTPFVRAFNDLHTFHGQTCSVSQGSEVTTGKVVGIGDGGELLLKTDAGEQRFHGGEVSLRAHNT